MRLPDSAVVWLVHEHPVEDHQCEACRHLERQLAEVAVEEHSRSCHQDLAAGRRRMGYEEGLEVGSVHRVDLDLACDQACRAGPVALAEAEPDLDHLARRP